MKRRFKSRMVNEKGFMKEMTERLEVYERALEADRLPLPAEEAMPDCNICAYVPTGAWDVADCKLCALRDACGIGIPNREAKKTRIKAQEYIGDNDIGAVWFAGKRTKRNLEAKKEWIRKHYKALIKSLEKNGYEYK